MEIKANKNKIDKIIKILKENEVDYDSARLIITIIYDLLSEK